MTRFTTLITLQIITTATTPATPASTTSFRIVWKLHSPALLTCWIKLQKLKEASRNSSRTYTEREECNDCTKFTLATEEIDPKDHQVSAMNEQTNNLICNTAKHMHSTYHLVHGLHLERLHDHQNQWMHNLEVSEQPKHCIIFKNAKRNRECETTSSENYKFLSLPLLRKN